MSINHIRICYHLNHLCSIVLFVIACIIIIASENQLTVPIMFKQPRSAPKQQLSAVYISFLPKATCCCSQSYLYYTFKKGIERLGAMIPQVSTPSGAAPGVSRGRSIPRIIYVIITIRTHGLTRESENNHLLLSSLFPSQARCAETNL